MPAIGQPDDTGKIPHDPDFLDKVDALCKERGQVISLSNMGRQLTCHRVILDAHPRVNGKQIDLQELYRTVVSYGGYDQVSREKLAWRKVAHEFGVGATNAAAYAFAMKTVYYKNLVSVILHQIVLSALTFSSAYEMQEVHGKEAPPKQILENVTAKGGDILTRTVQSYRHPTVEDADGSGVDEVTTPTADKADMDESGSGAGRSTRGLRQAPPQRVLFQPEVSTSRQPRAATGHGQSPQPTTGPSSAYSSALLGNQPSLPHNVSNYEPRPPMPLTLRGVTTPANNSTRFKRDVQRLGLKPPKDVTKPGVGFEGPNIYIRILNALKCPLQEENYYAVHHLVKISHERGDKFKYEAFPDLAEALIEFTLKITSVFYDIHWKKDYQEVLQGENILDCINGTPDVVERMKRKPRIDHRDDLEPEELAMKFQKFNEACLALRNSSLLEENARALSEKHEARDMFAIILSLPNDDRLVEGKLNILDAAEMVVRYWTMSNDDPLYNIFLDFIYDSTDRAFLLSSLRALCRISLNLEDNNALGNIRLPFLQKIFGFLLLQDEELVGVCLDFLYQFTAFPANVATLLFHADSVEHNLAALLDRLCHYMHYGEVQTVVKSVVQDAIQEIPAETIPNVPNDLLQKLLKMDEPERSNVWLKCVFEEHKDSEITQIALWQAYRSRFEPHSNVQVPNMPGLLPAAEFIKNVSLIFENATAQVINGPSSKFIIKGIRARRVPVDPRHHMYLPCTWKGPGDEKACAEFADIPMHLYDHIMEVHLGVPRLPSKPQTPDKARWDHSGAYNINPSIDCYWGHGTCLRFTTNNPKKGPSKLDKNLFNMVKHVDNVHIPFRNATTMDIWRKEHNRTPATAHNAFVPNTLGPRGLHDPRVLAAADGVTPIPRTEIDEEGRKEVVQYLTYHNTPVDERNEPTGLPILAAHILRNLARNIPKAADLLRASDKEFEKLGLVPVETLYQPMTLESSGILGGNRWKMGRVWRGELFGRGALWE
ncbi:MAG: hypothetical protein Q9174_005399 [Haloplaca sp. 1 TL-2023]